METQRFVEDAEIAGVRETNDGYLVANVRCARMGMQDYAGSEFGRPEQERVRVYRPEDEVFSKASLATFSGKPVTNDHPTDPVTAENWKDFAVGSVGEDVLRDGEYIRVPMTLMDAKAIKQVKDGKRAISMGYEVSLDFEQGTTAQGESYDAVMRDLKMNHLAIVHRGRAGKEVRIGDSWGAYPITIKDEKSTMSLKTIVVDGLSVETTDAGIAAIEKMQKECKALKDAADSNERATEAEKLSVSATHDSVLADKDKELAQKDAEILALQGNILTDADLDIRVAARAALVTKAQAIVKDADFSGKPDAQIKREAVIAARGADFAADKSEAYIEVAFDMLDVPKIDKVRDALTTREPVEDNDNGYSDYVKRLNGAYKLKEAV